MANFLHGEAGVAKLITWTAPFQTTGLFQQVRIINSSGAVDSTVNLSANGTIAYLYTGSWTPSAEGDFVAVIDVYTTLAGRTAQNSALLHESISPEPMDIWIKSISGSRGSKFKLGGGGRLTRDEIEDIAKAVWALKLSSNRRAQDELIRKSEFDVRQKVNTGLEEPIAAIKTEIKSVDELMQDNFRSAVESLKQHLSVHEKKMRDMKLNEMLDEMKEIVGAMDNLEQILEKVDGTLQYNNVLSLFENIEQLLNSLTKHKEVLFKFDETQREQFKKLINTIEKLPFSQNLALQGMISKIRMELPT